MCASDDTIQFMGLSCSVCLTKLTVGSATSDENDYALTGFATCLRCILGGCFPLGFVGTLGALASSSGWGARGSNLLVVLACEGKFFRV
jgi:hypothetical protein